MRPPRVECAAHWFCRAANQGLTRAAVLAANGREEEARRLAASVNWDRLKPQERDLIRTLRVPRG